MVCKIQSFSVEGLDALPVTVEVDVHQGLPALHIIGLGDRAVLESRMRVAAAIRNAGFTMPMSKVIVNLAPADRYKYGTALDLPIALGILGASKQIPNKQLSQFLQESAVWGELSLLGVVNQARGSIAIAMAAKEHSVKNLFLPYINAKEAGMIAGINIYPVNTLAELLNSLLTNTALSQITIKESAKNELAKPILTIDFADIQGQDKAKKALEIAAAGNHNILLSGPPGVGKTMLCQALSGILPPLNQEEALTIFKIQSIAGLNFTYTRPFRAPHHTATLAAVIGGGNRLHPGEITLAHNGVLFFDECNRFSPAVLEALREPLEQHSIRLSRNNTSATLPANFIFAAAVNPCPCGNWGSKDLSCKCSAAEIARFTRKMSAPILNRIELQIQVEKSPVDLFDRHDKAEASEAILSRVIKAKEFQKTRTNFNRRLGFRDLDSTTQISAKAKLLLSKAINNLDLSNRESLRLLNVARTIADLRLGEQIKEDDIAEAVGYRLN